jgi:16S rRNA (cytosine967-C5)-methyltransferase
MSALNFVSGQKPREIAARVLKQRAASADYVENLLDVELAAARLSTKDRALCQELVYGVVRWQAALDWLIARKTAGRTQKACLQILLRLGLYQIFWLDRIPDHAAVHETVELAKRGGFGEQSGFVNAVLRAYLREHEAAERALAELKTAQPHLGYSHPDWLCARWQNRWGAETAAQLMAWNNTPPKTYARVNALKADAGKLLAQWRDEQVEYDFFRRDWTGENLVFELKSHPPLAYLASFQQGLFYVQDPSTLLAVHELDPQPGETVFDFCAAPGGKTTYIAQLVQNQGHIVASDVSTERVKLIQENCQRLGVTCVEIRSSRREAAPISKSETRNPKPDSSQSLVTSAATRPGDNRQFDKVLVDVPCSNTGVMRRRVDLRWRIRPEDIERLRATQLDLLRQAAAFLKPGGTLVYSTCSLEPEENGEVVKRFLGDHAGFKLEGERELLPFVDGVDGAYVAELTHPFSTT